EDNPNYKKEVTAPDGHSYGFPYIEQMFGLVLTPGPLLINENWLNAVGMEMPTSPDELLEVLRAFRPLAT
ncbi:MAG: ABC transporter substrate-binding protein, partial [Clostridia bacterium]|nr:ABC transporter substrate-binding protein [Clostridia bacterium]